MAPNAGQHRAVVIESDCGENSPATPYRWECLCRRVGTWQATRDGAAKGGRTHERRFTPKPTGPRQLRSLLRLEF